MLLQNGSAPDSRRAAAAAQLEHHVDRAAGLDVVELERLVVRELLARVDQADLVDLDAFLLLELPLDLQDLVGGLEGHGLLAARQRLDEDLRAGGVRRRRSWGGVRQRRARAARDPLSLGARADALAVRSVRAYAAALRVVLQLFATRALRLAMTRGLDAAGDLHAAAQPDPLRLPLSRHLNLRAYRRAISS